MIEQIAFVGLIPGDAIGLQWAEVEAADQIGFD